MKILDLPEHIRILEELLLHQDFASSPEALELLLDPEFREVNPQGREVDRQAVIDWLLKKNPADRWEFTDFQVRRLAPGLALATYHARKVLPEPSQSGGAMHCSLWRESQEASTWQLVFHQSTQAVK